MGSISDQDAFLCRTYIFLSENVIRIYQSLQNQEFRVDLEKYKNNLIQKDKIR